MSNSPINLIGHTFGQLTVLAKHDTTKSGSRWLCECSCNSGISVIKYTTQLRRVGNHGCAGCESVRRAAVHHIHGGRGTALYAIWKSMRSRCRDKGHTSYQYYGGKGISISDDWDSFAAFRNWVEENGWADEDVEDRLRMSIDRIDSNKDYTMDNCRWITRSENSKRAQ